MAYEKHFANQFFLLLLNFKIQFALISIVIQHCNTVHLMYQEKQGLQ